MNTDIVPLHVMHQPVSEWPHHGNGTTNISIYPKLGPSVGRSVEFFIHFLILPPEAPDILIRPLTDFLSAPIQGTCPKMAPKFCSRASHAQPNRS